MMIQDKIYSGHFLLDTKNDHTSSMLMHHSIHQSTQMPINMQPGPHKQVLSPSSQMTMGLYTAYTYQHGKQEKLYTQNHHQSTELASSEVLDLSRRCDSVETTRKTPSPYNTSFGSSPISSPTTRDISNNTAYAVQQNYSAQPQTESNAPSSLYFTKEIKMETDLDDGQSKFCQNSPIPIKSFSDTLLTVPSSSFLRSFANVAVAALTSSEVNLSAPCNMNNSFNEPASINATLLQSNTPTATARVAITPPTSSISCSDKTTRPFKAFPRDPVVLAANFAATDVLLDNPRVERYTEYRKRVLEQIRNSNGGSRTVNNPKMRRMNTGSDTFHDVSNYVNIHSFQ